MLDKEIGYQGKPLSLVVRGIGCQGNWLLRDGMHVPGRMTYACIGVAPLNFHRSATAQRKHRAESIRAAEISTCTRVGMAPRHETWDGVTIGYSYAPVTDSTAI